MAFVPKFKAQRAIIICGSLVLLVALFYLVIDFHGSNAWRNYKREWEAKGEKFSFKDLVPKPVPDDQNFALAPIVASSFAASLARDKYR